ncbi:Fragile X mental retardation protein [Caligus rogercresseyi]|uniref:Fragile X mental retardation protein n=1 Tax=Caligus rogercresseyi TaxID=217165 RepID=A0A7T8KIX2_CALRO|nr:Fragile X mental retardation protein [Caligus rogercresseyi]
MWRKSIPLLPRYSWASFDPRSSPSHASLSPPSGGPLPLRAPRGRIASALGRKWKSSTPHGTLRPLAGSPHASSNIVVLCSSASAGELPGFNQVVHQDAFAPDLTCHTSRSRTLIPFRSRCPRRWRTFTQRTRTPTPSLSSPSTPVPSSTSPPSGFCGS